MRLPGRGERLAPDDRLARPEVGQFGEDHRRRTDGVYGGGGRARRPAEPAQRHRERLPRQGYVASTELLTRTEVESDFATDVCVRREGVDPGTGRPVPGGDLLQGREHADPPEPGVGPGAEARGLRCAADLRRPGPGGDVTVLGHERIV